MLPFTVCSLVPQLKFIFWSHNQVFASVPIALFGIKFIVASSWNAVRKKSNYSKWSKTKLANKNSPT